MCNFEKLLQEADMISKRPPTDTEIKTFKESLEEDEKRLEQYCADQVPDWELLQRPFTI